MPERREAVNPAIAVRPVLSPFLFCNRRGEGYIDEDTGEAHGWDSMWQRFMDRVLKETNVKVRFTEHDLRAKVGSDAESLEKATALLQHANARTTQRGIPPQTRAGLIHVTVPTLWDRSCGSPPRNSLNSGAPGRI